MSHINYLLYISQFNKFLNIIRNKIPNVPNLRFSTFTEEWQQYPLEKIAYFYKGTGISKDQLSEDGNECILYGELYTKYKTETITEIKSRTNISTKGLFFGKTNDVIIPASGETPVDIATACCVTKDDILFGGDLNIIRLHSDNGSFISYQLNGKRKYDIARIAQGASIVHLHNDDLKKLIIYKPNSLIEQEIVVEVFTKLDKRIELQSKIIEDYSSLKKSIIDNFFNELTNSSLGEHIIEITERNGYKNEYEVLSVSNKYGFIKQNEQFEDRIIASENKSNYKVVRKNTFAYNPTRINVGSIACMHYLDIGIVSPMYLCFSTLKTLSPYYLEYYFLSKSFKLEMNKKLEGSVRMCLQIDALKKIKLYIPSLEIQNKFVNKLSCFDKKIQKEKDILSLYKKQKAYLLQNMFI